MPPAELHACRRQKCVCVRVMPESETEASLGSWRGTLTGAAAHRRQRFGATRACARLPAAVGLPVPLVLPAGGFTDAGRETRERIETLTDELAAPAYDVLTADELDELIAGLEPIAAAVKAVDD